MKTQVGEKGIEDERNRNEKRIAGKRRKKGYCSGIGEGRRREEMDKLRM